MQDTISRFIAENTGKPNLGTTPENTGECVGLIQLWLRIIASGSPYIWGHAKDLFANAPDTHYIKIPNSPSAVPMPGDVIIWNGRMGAGFGHTAVVVSANINTFSAFEQNTAVKTPHTASYGYANVTGWIRPKNPTIVTEPMVTITQKELDTLREERDRNWNMLVNLVDSLERILT